MAERKKILLVSYFFPPLGMGGVGRALGLYKYLPEYGYDVNVLTVKNIVYPEYDRSLLEGLDRTRIVRAGSYDPSRLLYLAGFRKRSVSSSSARRGGWPFSRPDSRKGWVGPASRCAGKIIRDKGIAAVITTSPPPSSHLIGQRLKERLDIPWIADFRDLWYSLPIEQVYDNERDRKYSHRLKDDIVKNADEIVAVNNDIRKYLGRGEVITNGADPGTADIWHAVERKSVEKLTIGILGTINRLCPMEPLLKAAASMITDDRAWGNKLTIVHAGRIDMETDRLIDQFNLRKNICLKGYLPRKEAIEAVASADILYIAVGTFGGYNILPGRLFDYLVSGKPVVALVPKDSDAAALVGQYPRGKVMDSERIENLKSYIREMYDRRETLAVGKIDDIITEQYSSRHMARRYAAVLDRVILK